MPTLHIIVKGKVQGVFYRATAKEVADRCRIKGWVRNTKEGDVEIMASGSKEDLQSFVDWCRKGPNRAIVQDVFITTEDDTSFEDFLVIR
jgi:acylphosphatase